MGSAAPSPACGTHRAAVLQLPLQLLLLRPLLLPPAAPGLPAVQHLALSGGARALARAPPDVCASLLALAALALSCAGSLPAAKVLVLLLPLPALPAAAAHPRMGAPISTTS